MGWRRSVVRRWPAIRTQERSSSFVRVVGTPSSLSYDGQGFCLFQKRLSMGRFTGWPKAGSGAALRLEPHQLHLLLWNGDPSRAVAAPLWRAVPVAG